MELPKGAGEGLQSQETRPDSLPPLLLVGVPLVAKNGGKFAAFAGLKTHSQYAILSLHKNICSIFAHIHKEKDFKHDQRTKRCYCHQRVRKKNARRPTRQHQRNRAERPQAASAKCQAPRGAGLAWLLCQKLLPCRTQKPASHQRSRPRG